MSITRYIPIPFPENPIKFDSIDPKHKRISETFSCAICLNLVWKPESCSKCTRIFCSECINQVKSYKCPICQKQYVGNKLTITENSFLGEIELRCLYFSKEYEKTGKCDQILLYDNYEKHIENCIHRPYKCAFELCNLVGNINTIFEHYNLCEFNFVEYGHCKNHIRKRNLESHGNIDERKTIICSLCNETINEKELHKEYSDCLSNYKSKLNLLYEVNDDSLNEIENLKKENEKKLLETKSTFRSHYNSLLIKKNNELKEIDGNLQNKIKTIIKLNEEVSQTNLQLSIKMKEIREKNVLLIAKDYELTTKDKIIRDNQKEYTTRYFALLKKFEQEVSLNELQNQRQFIKQEKKSCLIF